jgi:hypothetical protein
MVSAFSDEPRHAMAMDKTKLFRQKAPMIMRRIIADFDLDALSAAAVLGNIGHECGGFRIMQETKPVVPGSRGGFGWCQWTGKRRLAMEAYCARNALDPVSDKANCVALCRTLGLREGGGRRRKKVRLPLRQGQGL